MTPKVLIRVDASREIGLGHLSRCMSLAGALRSLGADVTFLMNAPAANIVRRVVMSGFSCKEMGAKFTSGSDRDASITRGVLDRMGERSVVVVDHYDIGLDWEKRVRAKAHRLAAIDDLANREHECDILIDQNRPFDGAAAYRDLVPAGCALLTGPRFAILRPEFAHWRARQRQRSGHVRQVVISFGGSDPGGHTQAAMQALAPFLTRLEHIDVVVGPLNPSRDAIAALASSERVAIHVDPPAMGELLHAADIAIGAGGVSSWERVCLSVPSIAVGIVDNQVEIVRDLIRLGVAIGEPQMMTPSIESYKRWFKYLFDSPQLVRGMAEHASELVDGKGSLRAARHLLYSKCT